MCLCCISPSLFVSCSFALSTSTSNLATSLCWLSSFVSEYLSPGPFGSFFLVCTMSKRGGGGSRSRGGSRGGSRHGGSHHGGGRSSGHGGGSGSSTPAATSSTAPAAATVPTSGLTASLTSSSTSSSVSSSSSSSSLSSSLALDQAAPFTATSEIDFSITHPLQNEWTLWYDERPLQNKRARGEKEHYENNLHEIGTCSTVRRRCCCCPSCDRHLLSLPPYRSAVYPPTRSLT